MTLKNKAFNDIITFTRASGGGRFNASGNYEYLGNYVPRFDYDPVTLQPRGILIEEQRTNLLTYSSDLTNAVWSKENGTWANSSDSKFGSIGTFTENTATGARVTGRTVSLTAGTTYTHTERLKAAGRNVIRLQIFAGPGPTVSADFDLSSGTVSSVSGGTASITPAGDGWYDYSVTLSVTTTQAYIVRFYPIVAGGATYTGDGRVAFFHAGAQLEAGAFPTSYIPTVASQVTRSADVASVNTLSPWYNASEGTLFATYRAATLVNAARVAGFVPTAVGSYLAMGANGGSGTGWYSGGLGLLPAGVSGQTNKQALIYSGTTFSASINGSSVVTSTASDYTGTSTQLMVGQTLSGTSRLNGHIQSLEYYPRRLSNTELQEITA